MSYIRIIKSKRMKQMLFNHYRFYHNKFLSGIMTALSINKLYFPCVEISLTTFCTLCCEKCANLMQYYRHPYHVDYKRVCEDIEMLSAASDGIDCLRLVGGEPLLWPHLYNLLKKIISNQKIKSVLIITNGTRILPDNICDILSNNPKVKVSISNYQKTSSAISALVEQMEKKHIFYKISDVVWKDKANISFRNKSSQQLEQSFRNCPNDFFSLLNGELHFCPRSSHGSDLSVFSKRKCDFILLEDYVGSATKFREKIVDFMNIKYIEACNYCDEDISACMPVIEAAKQCSRTKSLADFEKFINKE